MTDSRLNAVTRILSATTQLSAKTTFYGAALSAIYLMSSGTPAESLPPALATFAGGLGVEALGSLIDRVANGNAPDEDDMREVILNAVSESGIKDALTRDELRRDLHEVIRKTHLDILHSTIEANQKTVAERLLDQSEQIALLRDELPKLRQQVQNISIEGDVSSGVVNIGGSMTIHGDGNVVNPPPGNDGQGSSSDEVNFRLYSLPVAEINTRSSIHIYAFVTSTLKQVEEDIQRFQTDLGGVVPKPREAKQTSMVERDTPITVIPESDELEFEPATLTKKWHGDWTRYDFDFRPMESNADETVFVRVSIQVEGIEIAHIKCAIEVEKPTSTSPLVSSASMTLTTSNPLAEQKYTSKTTTPYQRIFISYSRRDTQVARSYKLAQTALGNDVFLDVDNLRSGENWQAGLAKAIDEADIFQLFWSEHSAESQYCRYEWEYAFGHRCPDTQCEAFIRPVYWTKPMPKVPEQLRKLNFKFVPFEQSNEATD